MFIESRALSPGLIDSLLHQRLEGSEEVVAVRGGMVWTVGG